MRGIICCVLATVLIATTTLDARVNTLLAVPLGQAATEQKPTLKERLLEVPPGTMIEVRLRDKQKIRGRLGEIDDEGFNLTAVQGEKVVKQKIAYTELKSFKKVEGAKAGHALLYALAGIGVLFVVLIIWAASRSD
jgi:hypothetical protein